MATGRWCRLHLAPPSCGARSPARRRPRPTAMPIMTRKCALGNSDAAPARTNTEFDPLGYFYIVRVGAAAVNTASDHADLRPCLRRDRRRVRRRALRADISPTPSTRRARDARNDMNTYERATGTQRYASSPNTYCAGDVLDGGRKRGTRHLVRPPFADRHLPTRQRNAGHGVRRSSTRATDRMRRRTTTGTARTGATPEARSAWPKLAPTPCSSRPPGCDKPSTAESPTRSTTRKWPRCSTSGSTSARSPRPVAGDYYLQVRTNVKLATSPLPDGYGGYKNNSNVYTQLGDDNTVKGNGNNRFALRVTGAAAGIRVHRGLGPHVDLRELPGRHVDVQPGPGDPSRREQEPADRASSTSVTRPRPARSRCCPRSIRT